MTNIGIRVHKILSKQYTFIIVRLMCPLLQLTVTYITLATGTVRPMMPRTLVLVINQLSHVKVVLLHVLGHADLHIFVLWSKLVI